MDTPCHNEVKEKHPSWFKMKIERRELVRQLSPETAVNVLLACWEFLETGEKPNGLSPIESVAFASFMPDMDEAWSKYLQRITAKKGIDRYRTISNETEEETESESDKRTHKDVCRADKPPKRSRFTPPTVDEVRDYCTERRNGIDPERFVDYYAAVGWVQGKGKPLRDWKAAVRNWERQKQPEALSSPAPRGKYKTVVVDGEEVDLLC